MSSPVLQIDVGRKVQDLAEPIVFTLSVAESADPCARWNAAEGQESKVRRLKLPLDFGSRIRCWSLGACTT